MSVLEKGEAQVELAGQVYTLKVGFAMFRTLETLFRGLTFQQVFDAAEHGSYTHNSGIIWAMLRKHHPQMTMEDVDSLLDADGAASMNKILVAMNDLMEQMHPDAKDLAALPVADRAKVKRPRKARANGGIGVNSTDRAVVSA